MVQFCQNKVKIAIVGAGPSGVYCALNIIKKFSENNFKFFEIHLFDKTFPLKTILLTGGGRCNITNAQGDLKEFCLNYPRGEKFLYSLFSRHFNYDSIEFFNSIGLKTYTQDDFRVFPESNSAKDVRDKMLFALKKSKNVKFYKKEIKSIDELDGYNILIISAGSRNVENLLKSTNHPFIPFKKSLCALVIKDVPMLKGVSIKAFDGDFIFTDFGISGPLAFKISSINAFREFPYEIKIKLFNSEEFLDVVKKNPKKSIGNLLSMFIPKSLARFMVQCYDKKAAEVSRADIENLSELKFDVTNILNHGEIVNAGGVDLNKLNKNCRSKIKSNLWFCGEILNIDGFCGGYNLQNCWSSAYCVADDVVNTVLKQINWSKDSCMI